MRLNFYMTDHAILRFKQRIDPTLTIPQMKRRIRKAQEVSYKLRKAMAKQRPWRNEELRNAGDSAMLLLHDKQAIYILRLVEFETYNVVTIFSNDMVQGSQYVEDKKQAAKRRRLKDHKRSDGKKSHRTSRECRSYARGLAAEAARSRKP